METTKQNGDGGNNEVIDLNDRRAQIDRINNLLKKSPVSPDEQPPVINNYHHPDGTEFVVIGLREHYSKSAMYEMDRVLRENPSQFKFFIIEGLGTNNIPEVEYASQRAAELGIDILDIIVTPYNKIISDLAQMDAKDTISAIILAELSRYKENPESLDEYLVRNFGVSKLTIKLLYRQILKNIDIERKRARTNIEKLTQVSNDLSWHLLRQQNFHGRVLAVVGGGHSKIFDPNYKPSRVYTQEELNNAIQKITLHKTGVKNLIYAPDDKESIRSLLVDEEFFKEWEELKKKLHEEPHNDILKQKLRNLLLPDYEQLMQEGSYFFATQRAESMLKYGITGAKDLLERSLRADYEQLMQEGSYFYAAQRAEKLKKLTGARDADELIKKAKREHNNS